MSRPRPAAAAESSTCGRGSAVGRCDLDPRSMVVFLSRCCMAGWLGVGNIYLVTTPRNATVAEGNRIRLQCRAEGYPDNITYRWYRDGVDLQLIPRLMHVRPPFISHLSSQLTSFHLH